MNKEERVARWMFEEYSDLSEWDTAPQRKTDYYRLKAKALIKECEL